ncbi:MAG: HAD family hydrolase [Flammeovirgaceae bacterium]
MAQPINTIIFDLGGVLIDWNPKYLFRKMFDSEEEVDYFLNHICTYEWNLKQDAGRTWEAATQELIAIHPNYANEIKAYAERWEEMLGESFEETVTLLQELKQNANFKIYALTNWSSETFPIAQRRFEFLSWFEGIVVSGVEKTRKPAEAIYHILLERYQINAEQAVFIDDSFANIETAQKLGIHGIHCQDPAQVRSQLDQLLSTTNGEIV